MRGVSGPTLRAGWSRPGGEGKRRVGHGPLRVGLGCELGFLVLGLGWVVGVGLNRVWVLFLFLNFSIPNSNKV